MKNKVKILLFDQLVLERDKIRSELLKEFEEVQTIVATSKEEFSKAILESSPDLILAEDFTRHFDLGDALNVMKEQGHQIPVVSVAQSSPFMLGGPELPEKPDTPIDVAHLVKHALLKIEMRKENEKSISKLKQRAALFSEVLEKLEVGLFYLNLEDLSLRLSGNIAAALGYETSADDFLTENLLPKVTSDDRNKIVEMALKAMKGEEVSRCEFNMVAKDGREVSLMAFVRIEETSEGKPVAVLGSVVDQTHQKQSEEQWRSKLDEFQKSNEELNNFISGSIHDLRAPLTSMQSLIQLAKMESSPEERDHFFALMESTSHRMESTLQDILNYFRNARTEVAAEKINLRELFNDCFDNLKYYQPHHNFKWYLNMNDDVILHSDARRLKIICRNLLSNAIKYAKSNFDLPWVKINVAIDKSKVKMEFEDNGIGIADDKVEKIFEMFYQVGGRHDSSGLGLFIVKETVSKLSGEINVQSKLGEGTTFEVILPNMKPVLIPSGK